MFRRALLRADDEARGGWFLPAQEARAEACADDEVRGCSNASAEDNEGWGERRRREQVGDSGGGGYFLLGNMSAPGISS